mgnify:CR=1 FL=1
MSKPMCVCAYMLYVVIRIHACMYYVYAVYVCVSICVSICVCMRALYAALRNCKTEDMIPLFLL